MESPLLTSCFGVFIVFVVEWLPWKIGCGIFYVEFVELVLWNLKKVE